MRDFEIFANLIAGAIQRVAVTHGIKPSMGRQQFQGVFRWKLLKPSGLTTTVGSVSVLVFAPHRPQRNLSRMMVVAGVSNPQRMANGPKASATRWLQLILLQCSQAHLPPPRNKSPNVATGGAGARCFLIGYDGSAMTLRFRKRRFLGQ
jgi:hypothetical protein